MDTRVKPAYDSMACSASQHSQRLHVGFENGFLLGALVGVLLAQTHDRAQRLDVEAVALGLGVDVADIVGDGFLLFFQPLDALDDGLELIFCKCCRGLFLDGSGRGGHRVLLIEWVIESKAEGADASPRTASQNDPREWDDLRQADSAFIHSAPTGDSEIPFRQNEETGVSGMTRRVAANRASTSRQFRKSRVAHMRRNRAR